MIYIGSDHAGFFLKQDIMKYFKNTEKKFKDFGCYDNNSCNYTEIARDVCFNLVKNKEEKAILVCGTGVGMAIVANKFLNVRAVCASDHFSVKYSRLHNNANVLCLGARVVSSFFALELVELFLSTEFEGGRHKKRIEQIKTQSYNV